MAQAGAYKPLQNRVFTRNVAFNLSAIAAIIALVGLGFAYAIDAISARNKPELPSLITSGPTVEKTVSGTVLAIPPAWFRFAEQRSPGFSDKVDLLFALPLGSGGRLRQVEVSLTPKSRTRPSADLLDSVYLHQFTPEQTEGPPGLIGKPLRSIEGYREETVWYDPVSVNPFVAKCMAPLANSEKSLCLRTTLLTDRIAVTYTFDAELLSEWQSFDMAAAKWFANIGGI